MAAWMWHWNVRISPNSNEQYLSLENVNYFAISWVTADPKTPKSWENFSYQTWINCLYINFHYNWNMHLIQGRNTIIKRIKEVGSFIACVQVSLEVIKEHSSGRKVQIIMHWGDNSLCYTFTLCFPTDPLSLPSSQCHCFQPKMGHMSFMNHQLLHLSIRTSENCWNTSV